MTANHDANPSQNSLGDHAADGSGRTATPGANANPSGNSHGDPSIGGSGSSEALHHVKAATSILSYEYYLGQELTARYLELRSEFDLVEAQIKKEHPNYGIIKDIC